MAGHRRRTGRPPRSEHRNGWWAQQLATAPDAEAQLAVALDWLRAMAARHPDPAPALNAVTRFTVAQAAALRGAS